MQTITTTTAEISTPAIAPSVTFEVTRDWELVRQYFLIRQELYQVEKETKMKGLMAQGSVDRHDLISDIIVAKQRNECIGGARLSLYAPNSRGKLSLEGGIFELQDMLPDLGLDQYPYAELSRIIFLPECRGRKYLEGILRTSFLRALGAGCVRLLGSCPEGQARLYKLSCARVGVDARIRDDFEMPRKKTTENRRMYLIDVNLLSMQLHKMQGLTMQ